MPAEGSPEWTVQAQLVDYLSEQGRTIESQADTATKARGIDVISTRDGETARYWV